MDTCPFYNDKTVVLSDANSRVSGRPRNPPGLLDLGGQIGGPMERRAGGRLMYGGPLYIILIYLCGGGFKPLESGLYVLYALERSLMFNKHLNTKL